MKNKTVNKIDEGRVEGICKDIKRFKSLETLKAFLQVEIEFIEEEIEQRK